MSTTAEKIRVMQAFEDGAEIECKFTLVDCWQSISCPDFNWASYDYRIAPKAPETIYIGIANEQNEFSTQITTHDSYRHSAPFRTARYKFDGFVED